MRQLLYSLILCALIYLLSSCGGGGSSSTGGEDSTPANSPPSISALSANINRTETRSFVLAGTDADGDSLTYVISTASQNANVEIIDNALYYYPATGYIGVDSFSYSAFDGVEYSAPATVTVTVLHDPNADPYLLTAAPTHSSTGTGIYIIPSYNAQLSKSGRYAYYTVRKSEHYSTSNSFGARHWLHRYDLETNEITVVNKDSLDNYINIYIDGSTISPDGNFVVFISDRYDLVPNDTNGLPDRFRMNISTKEVHRINVHSNGTQADAYDGLTSVFRTYAMSADAEKITFISKATSLVDSDTNGAVLDAFMHNISTGETILVSKDLIGAQFANPVSAIDMSADGNKIVFSVNVSGTETIFLYTVDTDITSLIALDASLNPANGSCVKPKISGDGNFVLFTSTATNLDPVDTLSGQDLYVCDLNTLISKVITLDGLGQRIIAPYISSSLATPYIYDITYDGNVATFPVLDFIDIPNDTNGKYDIVMKNLQTNNFTLISQSSLGDIANNRSISANLDNSGSRVLFRSSASNLVPGDKNVDDDFFIRDLNNGSTIVLNKTQRTESNWARGKVGDLDATGRFAVFSGQISNLVVEDNNALHDVFIHDCLNGTTQSITSGINNSNSFGSQDPHIDDNANQVCFLSGDNGFVADDTNNRNDVILWNANTQNYERLNLHSDGTQANNNALTLNIDPVGSHVVFSTTANNLHTNDGDVTEDVYLRNILAGTTELVSLHSNGTKGNDVSTNPVCSNNATAVIFESDATNLIDSDLNGYTDIFRRSAGVTTLISKHQDGTQGDGDSTSADIDASGRYTVFQSAASNLVDNDTNNYIDVFLHDTNTNSLLLISKHKNGSIGNRGSSGPKINSDGTFVIFSSMASNLTDSNTNRWGDFYIYNISDDTIELATEHARNFFPVSNIPRPLAISGNGDFFSAEWFGQLWRFAHIPSSAQ